MINLISIICGRIVNRLLHFCVLFLVFHNCYAIDNSTITPTQAITDSQTLTSTGGVFKLGFFSPPNSTHRYIGIWYEFDPRTIVWVANRDNPLKDSTGTLRITDDGSLVVSDGRGVVFWTTDMSNISTPTNSVAELLDTGNFVLRLLTDVVWQSFDHPTNTLLPGMNIGGSRVTGKKLELTSWKSESDPSTGIFSAGPELSNANNPQLIIWRNESNSRLWRSGPWNKIIFIGIAEMSYGDTFYSSNQEDSMFISFRGGNKTKMNPRFVLDHSGAFTGKEWDANLSNLSEFWSSRSNLCELCSCLIGFKPKFENEWSKANWSDGCVRITQLECQNSSFRNPITVDGFIKLGSMKVPDYAIASLLIIKEMEECKTICLMNCSCLAYSYDSGIGCMTWGGNLVDVQQFTRGGEDLHVRLARSEIDLALKNSTDPARVDNTDNGLSKNGIVIIVIIAVLVGTLAISICAYFFGKWLAKQREKVISNSDNTQEETPDNPDQVKVFKFQELAISTNNFTGANILGQGGFGQVPAMSTTLSMLTSEITTLPAPKQPAFIERRDSTSLDSPAHSLGAASVNHLTITHIEGHNSNIIKPTQTITDSQTLTSAGRIFQLGFFSPPNSTNRYIGIWYEFDPRTIVWVANRINPLKDSTGTLRIADDGNLVIEGLFFGLQTSAELLDTGNLEFKVLNDDSKLVWQSFDHPTHTFLPGMKISGSKVTGKKLELRSWKSESDPSTGIFSTGLEVLDD
ncbi:hypothetical protein MKX03_025811 [Papaver bracteatum]|nr:hypothetical protein MKX03_025811 [Papaver bracteatum]